MLDKEFFQKEYQQINKIFIDHNVEEAHIDFRGPQSIVYLKFKTPEKEPVTEIQNQLTQLCSHNNIIAMFSIVNKMLYGQQVSIPATAIPFQNFEARNHSRRFK